MPAKFVLKQRAGKYKFALHATNGQVIASSDPYESKRAAMAGIRLVQKAGASTSVDDQTASGTTAKKSATRGSAAKKASARKATTAKKSTTTRSTSAAKKTSATKTSARKTSPRKTSGGRATSTGKRAARS